MIFDDILDFLPQARLPHGSDPVNAHDRLRTLVCSGSLLVLFLRGGVFLFILLFSAILVNYLFIIVDNSS